MDNKNNFTYFNLDIDYLLKTKQAFYERKKEYEEMQANSKKDLKLIYPCVVYLTPYDGEVMDRLCSSAKDEQQMRRIARRYFQSLILLDAMGNRPIETTFCNKRSLEMDLLVLQTGNVSAITGKVRQWKTDADIRELYKNDRRFEIDVFLSGMDNLYLSRAINDYLGLKTGPRVQVFSDLSKLATPCDSLGKLVHEGIDYIDASQTIPEEHRKARVK